VFAVDGASIREPEHRRGITHRQLVRREALEQVRSGALPLTPERALNGTHQHLHSAGDLRQPLTDSRERRGFETIREPTQPRSTWRRS